MPYNVPKRLFGAARNVEENGSLTIIATALVENVGLVWKKLSLKSSKAREMQKSI